MTTRLPYKTTFEPERVIQPIFTGGSVALDNGARILVTTLGEDAVLTDLKSGRQYAKIEGVRPPFQFSQYPNTQLTTLILCRMMSPSLP